MKRGTGNYWIFVLLLFTLAGCGYRAAGQASRLPVDTRTIAVPAFTNQTQSYRVEQVLTSAVVREFLGRTRYRINSKPGDSDLTLQGTVLGTQFAPVTYD